MHSCFGSHVNISATIRPTRRLNIDSIPPTRFDTWYTVYNRPPPWYRRADSWNNRGEITRKGREQRITHAVIVLARRMCQQGQKERASTVASRIRYWINEKNRHLENSIRKALLWLPSCLPLRQYEFACHE